MRKKKVLFWVAVLLLIGGASLGFPPYHYYCENNQANYYYCAANKVLVALGDLIDEHDGAITALATIAIAWFTWTLRESSEKMWDVANRTLEMTKVDMVADMVFQQGKIKDTSFTPVASVSFINTGRSRATDVTMWMSIGARKLPVQDSDFPNRKPAVMSRAEVGPQRNTTVDVSFSKSLSADELTEFREGRAALFVWGEIEYGTIFDQARIRNSFRLAIGGPYGEFRDGTLGVCETGNTRHQ
jgi:hypothetical protein